MTTPFVLEIIFQSARLELDFGSTGCGRIIDHRNRALALFRALPYSGKLTSIVSETLAVAVTSKGLHVRHGIALINNLATEKRLDGILQRYDAGGLPKLVFHQAQVDAVLEHQIEVQNKIARTNFYARTLLDENENLKEEEVARGIEVLAEEFLHSLFMVGQPMLTDVIEGTSGFAEAFSGSGQKDEAGRSLWDLDLKRRLFKFPLSYQIYSSAYSGLPLQIKEIVATRIEEILSDNNSEDTYTHLSGDDKQAIREILFATNWNS